MRVVIYDDEDLEPITVVNLSGFGIKDIERLDYRLMLHVPTPIGGMREVQQHERYTPPKVVMIWFERFIRRNKQHLMAFTNAAELAMLLDPAWLPGQRPAIERLENENRTLTRILSAALSG